MDLFESGGFVPPPVFFQNSILEPRGKDETERKMEKYLQTISKLSNGQSDREIVDALNLHISKGNYEEVQLGLLSMILTSNQLAPRSFASLTVTNRDNLKCVRDCLFNFTSKWRRLTDQTQVQIVWFTGELLRLGPNPVILDLVTLLFRNIAPGDLSPRNIWLAEAMLRIFTEHRAALDRQQFLVDCIVYCYLSIIVDHCHPSISSQLRKAEIDFTVSLLRDKWDECCGIGRDLIRLLHGVARIPEFEPIWHDVLYNPTALSPAFQGLVALLRRRTSRRFLILRITPDLEQKFFFVTSKVRMAGPYLRHLEWLKKSMMAAHGPTLRCELIRYICGLIHPSMETINSDVIQRWYIIGWLLKCHPTAPPGDIALAKLAIYFDWLGFDPLTDNVMNIEPGVLLIFHSKPALGNMASVLLDFLCRLATSFHPPAAEDIRFGMLTAFRHLQEKRVVPLQSIGMLFDPRHLEQDVFFLCRQTFPELLPAQPQTTPQTQTQVAQAQTATKFSDDEEVAVEQVPITAASDALPYKPFTFIDEGDSLDDLETQMSRLGNSDIALTVRQIAVASENEQKCQFVEDVIRRYQSLLDSDDAGQESTAELIGALPVCLLSALRQNVIKSPVPSLSASTEQIEESLSSPHFVIFDSILNSNLDEEDPARSALIVLVANMAAKQGRVLAHFLYFLAAKQLVDQSSVTKQQVEQLIRELTDASSNKPTLEQYLMGCLDFCQQIDPQLYVYLLPFLYNNFRGVLFDSEITATPTRLLKWTCQIVDAKQLAYLTSHILLRHLAFFTDANVSALLNGTLSWETIEQVFVWQILFAHSSIAPARLIPIVPKLKPDKHHEALVSLCSRFAMLPPSTEFVSAVFSRSPSSNEFASPALLKSWADSNPNMLIDSLSQLLAAGQQSASSTNLRGRGGKLMGPAGGRVLAHGGGLSRDQFLAHLDRFRQTAQDIRFLLFPPVQRLLQQVYQQATENIKNKYSDLFALIDEKIVNDTSSNGSHLANNDNSNSSTSSNNHTSSTIVTTTGNSGSGNNSPLSALSLLDSVASGLSTGSSGQDGGGVPRLSSSSSGGVGASSKLRRVQKRSPSQTTGNPIGPGSSSASTGGVSSSYPSAPKMTKFTAILPSD